MDNRQLRQKPVVSYEISSDSDANDESAPDNSPFGTPQKPVRARKRAIVNLDDGSESEVSATPEKTPPPRLSTVGHSLRQHKDLHLSLRAQENGDKPKRKKRRVSRANRKAVVTSDHPKQPPVRTERNDIRHYIATETAAKRNNFFVAHKHLFLPLLPKTNHITKLLDLRNLNEQEGDVLSSSDITKLPNAYRDSQENDLSLSYEALSKQPVGVKAVMKPYQISGLSFLIYLQKNGLSGILGDEMGLGKTLQTLSLIQYLKENRQQANGVENRPSLVICPLSVLSSWVSEARRWTPGLKVLRFHGPVHERDRLKRVATGDIDAHGRETKRHKTARNVRRNKVGKALVDIDLDSDTDNETGVDLIVTTYECFQADPGWFKSAFVWRYVILDEGHRIKNEKSQISRALQSLSAEFRLILTGTPLHNDMLELWALLHWLYPEVFTENTATSFKEAFNLAKGAVSKSFMENAARLLECIMLRRTKLSQEVDLNLPSKREVLLYTPLTPMQRFWYTRLITGADKGLLNELFQDVQQKEFAARKQEASEQGSSNEDLGGFHQENNTMWQESRQILDQTLEQEQQDESKKPAWTKLMHLLMQLRKVCNHPYLLPHAAPQPYYIGDHIMHASAKFIVLDKLIRELVIKQKKKILIFSGFLGMLDYCEDFLNLLGGNGELFKYLRLEGATARARRNLWIRMFNQQNDHRVMLISTRAGGLGINLDAASDVIILDSDFNPQVTLQAEARAHRIGQDKEVTVYKLCTQGTVEEQMLGRIQKKLYLSAKVAESMRTGFTPTRSRSGLEDQIPATNDDNNPQLGTDQLMSLVRRGAQALARPELNVDDMLNWEFSVMLEKCMNKPADALVAKDTGINPAVTEEDEKEWLKQVEHVRSRVFQGKEYTKSKGDYSSIAQDWSRADRRAGKETTVMVDGFAVSKQSMSCGDWEAVPTIAGKDPRLSEAKRAKKAAIVNQENCQVCFDGGDLILCSGCPRSYHYDCLDPSAKARSRAAISFNCSQHECWECHSKTGDAGGMLYRCRWCEKAYCEDCLDWDKTQLIGDNLKEFELLDYPAVVQAYYIHCPPCKEYHNSDPAAQEFYEQQANEIDAEYTIKRDKEGVDLEAAVEKISHKSPDLSETQSLTEGSTIESSPVATPYPDGGARSIRKKSKAEPVYFEEETLPLDEVGLSSDQEFSVSRPKHKSTTNKMQRNKRVKTLSSSSPLGAH
ncbi:MAG: hypothetical protein Q9222_007042 [Ikaeria aurantiellina]